MPRQIPTPEEREAEQHRTMLVGCGLLAGAFAATGIIAGGTVVGAIEAHYAQEEMSASTTSSRHPEAAFSLAGAGIGAGIGIAAAVIMYWYYIRKHRASTADTNSQK